MLPVEQEKTSLSDETLQKVRDYKASPLKKAALNILVKMASEENVKEYWAISTLKDQFDAINKDGTGIIKASEIVQATKERKVKMSSSEAKALVKEVAYQREDGISFTDFLSATLNLKLLVTEHRMEAIFTMFDTSQNQKLTAEDIYIAFEKFGLTKYSLEETDEMILNHPRRREESISFREFKTVFDT